MRSRAVLAVIVAIAGAGAMASAVSPWSPLRRSGSPAVGPELRAETSLTPSTRRDGRAARATDTVAVLIGRRLAGGGMMSPTLVRRFYEGRGHAAAWSSEGGVGREAGEMLRAVRGAEGEGLRADEYRAAAIAERLGSPGARNASAGPDPAARAELDILLTDAFLTLGTHLTRGRVEPTRIHAGWTLGPREVDVVAALEAALRGDGVERAVAALAPDDPEYAAVRGALRRYRDMAERGGWEPVEGRLLKAGDAGEGVVALRERLAAEMPVPAGDAADVFDGVLEGAVRAFQRSHGLGDDGVVGPATRSAMNVSAAARVAQLERTLERLRWRPADLGSRHIRVDIPAFELAVVENRRTVLSMRVIGGRPDWRTPIFSARMSAVVLSPYWNIPASIAAREVVPDARRDPGYLERNEIRVLSGGRIVSPANVNWSRFDASSYRLRQDPGPANPLGGVKFVFPNQYNVYLHDTPGRHLFAEPQRAFSHGCMRIEKPLELAEYLLGPLGWDRGEIDRAIARRVERSVPLPETIPVHVLYQTAWVDGDGTVQFREDLYGHDRRLVEVLEGRTGRVSELPSEDCDADAV
ncbi:MAG TPA: L,D-transpeptidase family protein [Longimicrobiaceae bacterium]